MLLRLKDHKKLVGILLAFALAIAIAIPAYAVLPDTVTQVDGTVLVVADTTDYSGDLGTRTDQIDLTSIAAGSARQSAKLDFTVNRALLNQMTAAIEFDVAPTSGGTVDFYLCFSNSATAGTANPGGTSGSDAAYTGTSGDSLDDSIKQCDFIGALVATADVATTVQFQTIGIFKMPERHANLVVDNNADQAFEGDANEMAVRILPLTTQIQE